MHDRLQDGICDGAADFDKTSGPPASRGSSHFLCSFRVSIPKGTLSNWVINAKGGAVAAAPGARTVAELEAEVAKLRKELAEARMERDIIKKAHAYFARESLQGTRS